MNDCIIRIVECSIRQTTALLEHINLEKFVGLSPLLNKVGWWVGLSPRSPPFCYSYGSKCRNMLQKVEMKCFSSEIEFGYTLNFC